METENIQRMFFWGGDYLMTAKATRKPKTPGKNNGLCITFWMQPKYLSMEKRQRECIAAFAIWNSELERERD